MVYDLLRNDPEIYRLMMYGIEGEMYTLDENGYMVRPEGFEQASDGVDFNQVRPERRYRLAQRRTGLGCHRCAVYPVTMRSPSLSLWARSCSI